MRGASGFATLPVCASLGNAAVPKHTSAITMTSTASMAASTTMASAMMGSIADSIATAIDEEEARPSEHHRVSGDAHIRTDAPA